MDTQHHWMFNSKRITGDTVVVVQIIHFMIFSNDWQKTKYAQFLIPSATTRVGALRSSLDKLNEVEGLKKWSNHTHTTMQIPGG